MNSIKFYILTGFSVISLCAYAQNDTIVYSRAEKLSNAINSSAEESFPIFGADRKTLYFARTFHSDNVGGKFSGQDIWTATLDGEKFTKAENLSQLNTKGSNVVVGTTVNGNRLYLLNQTDNQGNELPGISISDFDENSKKWKKPRPLIIPELNITGTYYSAYVSPNEDFILWSLPANEEAKHNDLYVSLSGDQGTTWTPPISLSSDINTEMDEISPFFDITERVLYFSVNKKENPDDYDIHYSRLLDDSWTRWSKPVNLGSKINSDGFDAYFYVTNAGTAYFCSNRNDSLSSIYISDRIIKERKIDEIDAIAAEVDTERRDPVLIIETSASGKTIDGDLESLSREELLDKETYIRFVYFEYDKYDIGARYIEVLDAVARILDDHPHMRLRIEGHTDAIGSDAYNQVLSENRAASAKEFLVINGVIPDRITTIGIGEKQPYASNLTEEGRALNRRVELFFEE